MAMPLPIALDSNLACGLDDAEAIPASIVNTRYSSAFAAIRSEVADF